MLTVTVARSAILVIWHVQRCVDVLVSVFFRFWFHAKDYAGCWLFASTLDIARVRDAAVLAAGVESTLFEYWWDAARAGWVPWLQLVPHYVHRPELPFNQILVPTVDTVRTTWILDILVHRQCPVRHPYIS